MTLDEAIKHCLKQARKLQDKADRVGDDESRQCMECAADHIQLADWLIELKDLRAEQHEQGVFIKELMKHSAADVKRGKWIEKAEDYYRQWQDSGRSWDDMPYFITGLHFACGVCFDKYEVNAEGVEFWDFCPHCGADMRGEDSV